MALIGGFWVADGVTHHAYLKTGWILVLPVGIIITIIVFLFSIDYFYLYPLFFYINYILCNIIDPDADQISITMSEGIALRTTKNIHIAFGILGALFVSYSFIYAYLIGLVGGHRSWFSHGWIIGTIGRMIFYNLPLYILLWNFYYYGINNWNWTTSIGLYESTKMQIWLKPYLTMQFLSWFIGDGIHLILDTEFSKGVLYTPKNNQRD